MKSLMLATFFTLYSRLGILSFFGYKKIDLCVELAIIRKHKVEDKVEDKVKDKLEDTQLDEYDDYDNPDFSEHQQRCHFIYEIEYCY
jgi:hypothetical protein